MKYSRFIERFRLLIIAASIALFAVSIHFVAKLSVKSDFKELLPASAPSVVELNRIQKRVRSTDNLIILVGGVPWEELRPFIDSLASELENKLSDDINRIEYNVTDVKGFFEKNKYLYIDLPDLEEIYDRLKRRIDWEKIKHTPFFLQIAEEEPTFETKDIEDKYRSKTGRYQDYNEGYFTDNASDLAAIIVWPREGATNVEFSKRLMARIHDVIVQTPGYDPSIKIAFAGRIKKMASEYEAIIGDILKTTLLCVALIGALVFLYFRKLRMGMLMMIAAGQGTLLSLAIASALIGYLTTQTAFLGSIIVGNGINYSLILMARYIEERREKRDLSEALAISLSSTWRPTFVAAIVSSASFAALTMAHVRSISQFGVIGGMGMILCWIATYTVLPAWLSLSEKIWQTKVTKSKASTLMEKTANLILSRTNMILKISAAVTVIFIGVIIWFVPRSLEYDFSRLSFKPLSVKDAWEKQATDKLGEIFGESTSPSVVVLDRSDQESMFCDSITEKDPDERYIEKCKTLLSYVPSQQKEKLGVLHDMRELLSSSTLKFLKPDQLEEVEKFKKTFNLKELSVEDLPQEVVEMFKDVDGNQGLLAYVYPKADLWNGKELMKFSDMLRQVDLPNGEVVRASGQPVILADLLNTVVKEGPKVTLASFSLVLILVWLNFRNRRVVAAVLSSLVLGVLWLLGCMGIVNIKLNFLNFVALPITFGVGVDYAVNIYQRYRQDGIGSIHKVIANTGGAVILCSLTTIIGYSVLLMSRSRALVSFGLVALLGELTCLGAALIALPAFIVWRERREALTGRKNVKDCDVTGILSQETCPRRESL